MSPISLQHRLLLASAILVALLAVAAASASAHIQAGNTALISKNTAEQVGNMGGGNPSVSANGRYIAFESDSTNLVPGDDNASSDVYLSDTETGTKSLVSRTPNGSPGNDGSFEPSISADGRFVAFSSIADDLVAGDNNAQDDVFVYDAQTNSVSLVSKNSAGTQSNGSSDGPSISADGHLIAFDSDGDNLVNGDSNSAFDVFLRDTSANSTRLITAAPNGDISDDGGFGPSISADGNFVAFSSDGTNLVSQTLSGARDIFLKQVNGGGVQLISQSSQGAVSQNSNFDPSVSADGRYVAFLTTDDSLANENNGDPDIVIRDTKLGTTSLVSRDLDGSPTDTGAFGASISADGRFVAYSSDSSGGSDPSDGSNDLGKVFVTDTKAGSVRRVGSGNGGSGDPAISADGRYVAFDSFADNITKGDSNNTIDVFLRNLDNPGAAAFTSAPTVVRAGVPVKFDGSASKGSQQPSGSFTPVANYSWAFQTGTRVSGAVVSQTFQKPGNYVASLDITDADGNTASVKHPIVVQQPEFKLDIVSKGRLAKALKTGKLKVQVTSTRAAGIRTGLRLKAAKGKRTSALGKTVATVFPTTLGGTKTVTLKLTKKTRSRLAKSKKLRKRVLLQTAGKSNNGAPVVSQLAQRKLR